MTINARHVALALAVAAPSGAACLGTGADAPAPVAAEGGSKGDSAAAEGRPAATDGSSTDGRSAAGEESGARMDGSVDATQVVTTTSTKIGLRVANWSPDAPALDFCIASFVPPNTTGPFQGPVLASDGAAGALAFPQVTSYKDLPPGQYAVRMVLATPGIDCSLKGLVVPDFHTDPLKAGATATVALVGEAQQSGSDPVLKSIAFQDDYVGPSPKPQTDGALNDRFALRFVNGAPGMGPVDFGTVDSSGKFTDPSGKVNAFSKVAFGKTEGTADGGGIDPNNYSYLSPWTSVTVRARLTPMSGAAPDAGVPLLMPDPIVTTGPGAVVTIALLGTTSNAGSMQLLECVDNAGTIGPYSLCTTISVSTCGNAVVDPFEGCDCGISGSTPTDSRCFDSGGTNNGNGPCVGNVCNFCSNACTVN